MAGYNRTRYVEQLLETTQSLPPSFTVHLHSEYWVLNNGSKFLYNNQIASLLDDIRAHRIPIDFLELFDSARVPFYEGCMVVELLDYRPQKSSEPALKNPNKTRVVLHPSPETLWADLCSLNQRNGGRWTDMDALEIEAKLLLATSQPLCLDPDPHLTRIVNNVLRASTPSMPLSLKRKSSAMEPEEDGPEKARRERLLGFMAPRDNRLHAPSYRLLDAIEINKQKKEANKAAGANQQTNQYIPANSQSVQLVPPQPQPTPTPQPVPAPVAAHSPQGHGETPAQTIDTPQTFNVPFRPNGAHTPVPQPAHQFVGQHPSPATLQPSMIQPQAYVSLQAVQEAATKRASTPAQPQQIQAYHYMQQYPYSQLQQQPHQTASQSQVPRPPSQPQHLPAHPATPTLPSPQPAPQQLNAQLGQPQRYTQTPKPPQVQPTTVQPSQTQQPPNVSASPFQGDVPNPHFIQPASAIRRTPQSQPSSSQHPHLTLATNTNPSQSQHLYNPQQPHQPSLQQQQAQLLYQQRFSQAAAATGGRTTPAQTQQSPRLQPQPNRTITATPSPAKSSPLIHQRTIGTPIQPRASPLAAKAQIPIQPSGSGQPLPVLGQQSQIAQPQQLQQLSPGGVHMQPQRFQFQSQSNHSQLRPHIHGNPQMIVAGPTGTPTMAHASPVIGGRPLTPGEGKSPHPQPNQTQQQPTRRPTPLQHQQPTAIAQLPAHFKQQQKTPQLQPQQLPQSQQTQHGQQIQGQAQASPQVQQANLAARQQQLQHQQMQHQQMTFAQIYGFPYWSVPAQQQGQPSQVGSATAASQLPPQMGSMSPQQQSYYQHHLGMLVNQLQQSPGSGQRMTHQQKLAYAHKALMQAASVGQAGGQQVQGGQSVQQQPTQHPLNSAQAQATMMGKMQMQVGPQIQMQQGHTQGVVGGHAQTTNISPAQMHMPHFQQPQAQHRSPNPQAQQKAKPAAAVKKGPAGR